MDRGERYFVIALDSAEYRAGIRTSHRLGNGPPPFLEAQRLIGIIRDLWDRPEASAQAMATAAMGNI